MTAIEVFLKMFPEYREEPQFQEYRTTPMSPIYRTLVREDKMATSGRIFCIDCDVPGYLSEEKLTQLLAYVRGRVKEFLPSDAQQDKEYQVIQIGTPGYWKVSHKVYHEIKDELLNNNKQAVVFLTIDNDVVYLSKESLNLVLRIA